MYVLVACPNSCAGAGATSPNLNQPLEEENDGAEMGREAKAWGLPLTSGSTNPPPPYKKADQGLRCNWQLRGEYIHTYILMYVAAHFYLCTHKLKKKRPSSNKGCACTGHCGTPPRRELLRYIRK